MAFGIRSVDLNPTSPIRACYYPYLNECARNSAQTQPPSSLVRRRMIIAINRQGDPPVGEASKPIARSLLWPSVFAQSILTQPPSSLVRRGMIIAINRQWVPPVGEASLSRY